MPNAPVMLPVEIRDSIIDHLADDWRTLAACALTSPDWVSRVQLHLQKCIKIPLQADGNPEVRDFMQTFTPGSPLADMLVRVHICGSTAVIPLYAPLFQKESLPTVPDHLRLRHLRNVQSLSLTNFCVSSVTQFRSLYICFPRLEELYVYQLFFVNLDPLAALDHEDIYHHPDSGVRSRTPLPLKILRVDFQSGSHAEERLSAALCRDADGTLRPLALNTLSLHIFMRTISLSSWVPVLVNSRDSLRALRFSVRRSFIPAEHAAIHSAIAQCTGLQKLMFTFIVGLYIGQAWPVHLSALSTWLSTSECAFTSSLSELTLHFWGPLEDLEYLGDAGSAALADLAHVLLPHTFSSLASLEIFIHDRYSEKYYTLHRKRSDDKSYDNVVGDAIRKIETALRPLSTAGVQVNVQMQESGLAMFLPSYI
ncbi:hypothetical protein BC628DRAFT_1378550 [Trametes gibbosa]|nr:hypothetical protein BC628DRAFT_1378550 [Trametes gibbosa]